LSLWHAICLLQKDHNNRDLKKHMKMKRLLGIFAVALLGGAVALGLNELFFKKTDGTTKKGFEQSQKVYFTNQPQLNDAGRIDFVEVAERSTPTVVHIKTTVETADSEQPDIYDPFGFFDDRMFKQQPRQGSGSGVIIMKDGYIATNNHVVEGATKIEVTLWDKRTYEAELVGRDPETDLALIKIEENDLSFLPFGNSDEVRVGEWVIAVGNPFNLNSTVTAGIVSAKGRNINLLRQKSAYAIENFIQTDAAVNPGNSGGALVSTKGELIGINTAIASRTGSYAGYSFAVPVNIAKKVLDDLLNYGEVKRAILGVRIQDMTQELADEKGITDLKGVFIPEVIEGGAGEKGGIESGDVILKIDDVEVNKSSALQEQISKYHPGDEVKITLSRDGEILVKDITLLSKNGEKKINTSIAREEKEAQGATFENLSREEKLELKVRNGVRIKSLSKGAFKDRNIPEGFVITHIDKQRVGTTSEAVKMLESKRGSVLIDGVLKNGTPESYAIRIEDENS
jgi:serine protease Do